MISIQTIIIARTLRIHSCGHANYSAVGTLSPLSTWLLSFLPSCHFRDRLSVCLLNKTIRTFCYEKALRISGMHLHCTVHRVLLIPFMIMIASLYDLELERSCDKYVDEANKYFFTRKRQWHSTTTIMYQMFVMVKYLQLRICKDAEPDDAAAVFEPFDNIYMVLLK